MSDQTVRAALRSEAPLVVVEAPAGCGKTYQGADYACEMADTIASSRVLVVTHTHAACSVFSERTKGAASRIEIRTIDGVIAQIASAYHVGLGLPSDIAAWVRQFSEGHALLAQKVALLLKRYPMIGESLAQRYRFLICDEHQDSSGDQHAIIMVLLNHGAKVRVFADPMQKIFKDQSVSGGCAPYAWNDLIAQAQAYEQLDTPHRWSNGCSELGRWTLAARSLLKTGGRIDLKTGVPPSVEIVFAENQSMRNLEYQLSASDRRPVDLFERVQSALLILTRHTDTARSFRAFFNRRLLLWEGHTRTSLDKLAGAIRINQGDSAKLAAASICFLGDVGKGFSASAFGERFEREVREGCMSRCRGKPAVIQQLAKFIVTEADHRGVSKFLRHISHLRTSDSNFAGIEIDCHKEFWEAVSLGDFNSVDEGLAEINNRRTYSRPKPPVKAISTIHKAKGLECENVIIMPCDGRTFPDKPDARCLLYVALSRATTRLVLVVSRTNPSPLLEF
jgi:DNA helicase-2/ATP-dependent DNA helicase PcrA